jgi:hypothetical protein
VANCLDKAADRSRALAARANCENVRELEVARAQFGSLTDMKRNICLRRLHLKGFQPLHFTWQP